MKVYNSVEEFREYIDTNEVWGKVPVYMTSGGFDPLHVGHLRCILKQSTWQKKMVATLR